MAGGYRDSGNGRDGDCGVCVPGRNESGSSENGLTCGVYRVWNHCGHGSGVQ